MTDMKNRKAGSAEGLLKRKRKLLKTLEIPADALPGSLSFSRFRCGKPGCHCRKEEGHEKWTLTYMHEGAKHVKHIPADLVEYVRQKVKQGKTFKEEVNEIFGANAELLVLLRKDSKQR